MEPGCVNHSQQYHAYALKRKQGLAQPVPPKCACMLTLLRTVLFDCILCSQQSDVTGLTDVACMNTGFTQKLLK